MINDEILNITNGDYFNDYFLAKFGGTAIPFCEVMMDGETVTDIYSEQFITLRSKELNVTEAEYRSKMQVYEAWHNENIPYSELHLWFGKDTFCQMNLLTLLAYLEQIGYGGKVILSYINDETFAIMEENIPVKLGTYKALYEKLFIEKLLPSDVGILSHDAIELYFDYHSDEGALARMVKEHPDMDDLPLLCLLLRESGAYGLSDLQAKKLIQRNKLRS